MEKEIQKKMEDALGHLQEDLRNLRTNRPNPGMLDSIVVEVYGSNMKIRDLGSVAVADRQLVVTAYDAQTAGPISKAIEKSSLGLQPILEGNIVRVPIPPMSEEVRKDMAKQAKEKGEKAKVSIRNIRRDGNDLVRKQKSSGDISEDDQKRLEKKIQELTDKCCKEADELVKSKEKDILVV
ncbi:MAG: ribosome recycling factor [Candidatus Algichlamydia australiensis]|nr:ribosome recycling factor [Chlamydiales bacterium]